jgi:3-phenylpropionate/cinnamic acid dioxygenase small subunit
MEYTGKQIKIFRERLMTKMPPIEDRLAINDLFVRYMRSIDDGDVEALVSCFTGDGALDSPTVGKYEGRQGIRDFAARFSKFRENGYQLRHVISNMQFDIEGERANVYCYLVAFLTHDKKSQLLAPGHYECRLRKENGEWKFEYRLVVMDGDYTLPGI